MTIAALKALYDHIDHEGGPAAARAGLLRHHTTERNPVTLTTGPSPAKDDSIAREAEELPVGALLHWADTHEDPEVQDQSARARAALTGLRQRYIRDHELAAISTEAEQLEQRLAELRAREAELAPAKARRPKTAGNPDAAAARAWAKENNVPCPDRGRVPKDVMDAWREATSTPAPEQPA